ncbi:MAG: two-component system response regulator [Acidobacteria bacterium]|nr:MAG: two-component system response regulator [Acidobacteriota bacterium]
MLVIDDENDIRRIARLGLERVGKMQVIDASSGVEGVEKARAERPDVVLLDVMMPGQDGPATLQSLKADPATAAIPVIFLTAKALASELERLRSLGATGVLTKPFDAMTLAAEVRAILDRS